MKYILFFVHLKILDDNDYHLCQYSNSFLIVKRFLFKQKMFIIIYKAHSWISDENRQTAWPCDRKDSIFFIIFKKYIYILIRQRMKCTDCIFLFSYTKKKSAVVSIVQ